MRIAAQVYALLAGVVILFQMAVILGAPWGHLTQGGFHPGVLPLQQRVMAVASVVLMAGMAFVMLSHAGVLTRKGWTRVAIWGVVVMAVLGAVMNLATPSAPERMIWAPVTLVMLVCAVLVARAKGR
jgi:hypothetical protein